MRFTWQSPFRFAAALCRSARERFRGVPVIAPDDVIDRRDATCAICEFNRQGQCTRCDCVISMKTLLSSERCPDVPPRWLALIKKTAHPVKDAPF